MSEPTTRFALGVWNYDLATRFRLGPSFAPLPCGGISSAVFDICVGRQIRIFNYISCLDKGVLWQSSMPVRTSISQSFV